MAACDVIIGEPSSVHFGAATAVARSPMSAGLPAIASRRSCARSSNTAFWPPAIDSDDRAPEVVALGRLGRRRPPRARAPSRSRSARWRSTGGPRRPRCARGRRAGGARPASSVRMRRNACSVVGRHVADEGELAGCRGRGAAPRPRRCRSGCASAGAPSTSSVSGVTPMENDRAERRVADRRRPRRDRPTRRRSGCSGGYSVQLRAAASSARASCSRPRASSGDSWETWDTR